MEQIANAGNDIAAQLLTPIMEQLAALQRQVAGMGHEMPPTPVKAAQELAAPDVQELEIKRASNREQFHFCRTVNGLAAKALEWFQPDGSLQPIPGAATTVRDFLRSIEENSSKRQKLIKLADRSEAGWATVNKYVADPIADDSSDERRMRKAEKLALAGMAKNQGKNTVQVGSYRYNNYYY